MFIRQKKRIVPFGRGFLCFLLLFFLKAADAPAFVSAGSAQQVQLTVVAACSVSAPGTVNFGNVPVGNTASPVTTNITVSCGSSYYLGVNWGLNWDGTNNRRRMANGGTFIPYTLTENSTLIGDNLAAAQALGMAQTTDATNPAHGTFPSTTTSITITASAIGAMPATTGLYSDTVVYTVAW